MIIFPFFSSRSESGTTTLVVQPPTPDKEISDVMTGDEPPSSPGSMSVQMASSTSYRSPEIPPSDIRPPRHRRGRSVNSQDEPQTAFVRFPNSQRTSVSRSRSTSPVENETDSLTFVPKRSGTSEARKAATALLNLPDTASTSTTTNTSTPKTSPKASPPLIKSPGQLANENEMALRPTPNTISSSSSSTPTQSHHTHERPDRKHLRPQTLQHTASESGSNAPAYTALRLKLDMLGKPKFDAVSGTFQIVPPSEEIERPSVYQASAPLIRKKSGELVKPSLKTYYVDERLPAEEIVGVYDPTINPKYMGSKSAPTTPSCPKYVHFDTKLERVKLFLAEQKPAAVSRNGSPTASGDENGSSDFPFPTTSDEEEAASKGLEIRLPNWPARSIENTSGDVWMENIVLAEGARNLTGSCIVRNLSFSKVRLFHFFDSIRLSIAYHLLVCDLARRRAIHSGRLVNDFGSDCILQGVHSRRSL